jgi:hypothetical protein
MYFIDEAHLINEASKALLKQIETMVYKSSHYFLNQNPMDISSGVNTIGAKTQHALSAFIANDRQSI